MSTIPLLARRRLCNTFNAQEVGQLRAALQDAGVEFVITRTAARWADSPAMEPPAQPSIWGRRSPLRVHGICAQG
mgnify:CR=1 FL=1